MSNDSLIDCITQLEAINYEIGWEEARNIGTESKVKQREICRKNLDMAISLKRGEMTLDDGHLKRIIETAIYFTDQHGDHDDFSKHAAAVLDTIKPYLKTATSREESKLRACTCHPDDNPPRPCPQKYASSECQKAATENGDK